MRAFLAAFLALVAIPCSAATLAVNLSGTTGPDFANQLVDTDVEVARFVLQPSGGNVDIDEIVIHVSSFATADEAFTGVRLFFDADGNGTFDPSEEISSSQVPNGTTDVLTFTETFTAPNNLIRTLQLRVNIGNNTSVYGQAYNVSIDPQADITLTNPGTDTISSTTVAVSNDITIRHSENQLVAGLGNPTAPREANWGDTDYPALHFIVSSLTPTGPGQLQGIDLASVTISVTCQTAAQTAQIERLALWQDNGNSSFQPNSGEVLIQSRTPLDVGKWVVAGSVINVTYDGLAIQNLADIPSGGTKALWVGIDFDSDVNVVCEVTVTRTNVIGALGAAADFMVTSPNLISGNTISVFEQPPPPKTAKPPGEGGCSTSDESSLWLVLAAFALMVTLLARVCKQKSV